jgi:hypothetical protein
MAAWGAEQVPSSRCSPLGPIPSSRRDQNMKQKQDYLPDIKKQASEISAVRERMII